MLYFLKGCSMSCKTCFGNMLSQCSGCKEGYLLQKGRCMKSCDENFYLSEKYCIGKYFIKNVFV